MEIFGKKSKGKLTFLLWTSKYVPQIKIPIFLLTRHKRKLKINKKKV